MSKPTSSFGSARQRRHAKAQADQATAHVLWYRAIADKVAGGATPQQALSRLAEEVKQQAQGPRKQQVLLAWAAFVNKTK